MRLLLSVIKYFILSCRADTSNVKFTKSSPAESSFGPTTGANEVSSTQQAVRRSPNIIDSGIQRIPNMVPTDRPRTRIPSTWITSSTTTTTPRSTSTRAPLRTSYPTIRAPTVRSPPATSRPVSEFSLPSSRFESSSSSPTDCLNLTISLSQLQQPQQQPQPTFLIDNIFAPRPNGPITRSINKIINTTEQVVNGFAGMFRTTLEIITGTG